MKPKGPTEGELIRGQAFVEVSYRDGARKEVVTVRLLSVREIDRYAQLDGDSAAVAELFAGKKKGWADELTNESVYALVAEGERINADPFAAHLRYLQERRARMAPIAQGAQNPSPAGSLASASGPD